MTEEIKRLPRVRLTFSLTTYTDLAIQTLVSKTVEIKDDKINRYIPADFRENTSSTM